jgi:hypothetical protein
MTMKVASQTSAVYIAKVCTLTSGIMPHACHDGRTTAVIGSHSKTPHTTCDLGTSRSKPTMK